LFEKYVEQALNIFNYVDSIVLTDDKGIIRYFHTNRSDINKLDKSQVLGKYILEMYENLTQDNSTILEVLNTGKPILNRRQELVNINGLKINAITSTLPIEENGKIIGTIDVSSYAAEPLAPLKKMPSRQKSLYQLSDIVSIDSRMNELKENIKKVAQTSSAVMIQGETGTGKELVAQSIHTCGERKNHKFISQNCAAIPSTLMESILFGTKKGSFTGAEDSPGLFELANGGTLFLDEINSMESSIQPKLLKAVEEKKITRLGDSKPIYVDVKIISAINESTETIHESGSLRKDLIYRLNTVCLKIPPLRERIVDIAPLSKSFIKEFNYAMSKNIIDLTEEVYDIFSGYDWPGNVRELKNIIEGAFNLCDGRFIGKQDLPEYLIKKDYIKTSGHQMTYQVGLKNAMEQIEKDIIVETLKDSSCRAEAARKLKLSKQAFQYKLEKYKLEDFYQSK
jgi:arginine utilization regulatory protein